MLRRLAFAALPFVALGCGVDPETSRLIPGSEAVLFDARSTAVRVGSMPGEGLGGEDWTVLPTGDPVLVQSDPGTADPKRPCYVVARTGEYKGRRLRVTRDHLRPH